MRQKKNKISVSIDLSLIKEIGRVSSITRLSRSKIIEFALEDWRKKHLKKQMIEGYKAMAKENLKIAKEFEKPNDEVWTVDKFPKRGQIWSVKFDPKVGSEQGGTRPTLILQNNLGNQFSNATIVAAPTTTMREMPVHVFLDKKMV